MHYCCLEITAKKTFMFSTPAPSKANYLKNRKSTTLTPIDFKNNPVIANRRRGNTQGQTPSQSCQDLKPTPLTPLIKNLSYTHTDVGNAADCKIRRAGEGRYPVSLVGSAPPPHSPTVGPSRQKGPRGVFLHIHLMPNDYVFPT